MKVLFACNIPRGDLDCKYNKGNGNSLQPKGNNHMNNNVFDRLAARETFTVTTPERIAGHSGYGTYVVRYKNWEGIAVCGDFGQWEFATERDGADRDDLAFIANLKAAIARHSSHVVYAP